MHVEGHVVGIERFEALAKGSRDNLRAAGLGNLLQAGVIDVQSTSAFSFTSSHAFDFIHVGAAATEVPMNLVRALRQEGQLLVYV